jgi:hypothetical protein
MKPLLLLFLLSIVACRSEHKKEVLGEATPTTEFKPNRPDSSSQQYTPHQPGNFPLSDTLIDGKEQYTYIKSAYEKNGMFYINADYIQFLTGDAALAAAKKNGTADTTYDDKGNITNIGVDDDYLILNENSKIRTLQLSPGVVIETILPGDDPISLKRISVNDFRNQDYTDRPFILTMRNETVVAIREVYVP